jgi:hypothetical protein
VAVSVSALGDVGLLVASGALLLALGTVAQWLWQSRQSTDWDNSFRSGAAVRGVDSRIGRLASDVRAAESGTPAPAARLHATLSSLAAERLRNHAHSDNPTSNGEAILGRELAAYLAAPPTTRLTAAQLAAFTTTLEDLS